MLTYPNIDPIIFEFGPVFGVGPIAVRWYGMMYVLGFIAGWLLARHRSKKPWSPVSPEQVDDLVFNAMVGVIVGGRLGYCLVYGWDDLVSDPLYIFKITEGGMSFHGGLVGVLVAMWLFGRKRGKTMWQITDFMAPFVPLGLGFGRIGNFINGELWGKPTDVPWGFKVGDQVLHASMLYEAILEGFVLFAILWWYSAKERPYLAVSGMFLFFYGAFRFYVEFYRVPDEHLGYIAFGWLTTGQILTLPMIIIGAWLIYRAYARQSESKT